MNDDIESLYRLKIPVEDSYVRDAVTAHDVGNNVLRLIHPNIGDFIPEAVGDYNGDRSGTNSTLFGDLITSTGQLALVEIALKRPGHVVRMVAKIARRVPQAKADVAIILLT